MVMIVEGVLNGSGGAVYYPANELRDSTVLWNGKPVVVYHPDQYGESWTGLPEVYNKSKVGTIFNTVFENRSLKAEAWIDVERVQEVDDRVYQALMLRQPMEVSTGLLIGNDRTGGCFNGKNYDQTARGLVPDHLAILPDIKGACSLKDGCGLARNGSTIISAEITEGLSDFQEWLCNLDQPQMAMEGA
jgi:hypothetical protein